MINSTSNKQVKRVVSLRSKAKARREEGMYVVEGLRMCRELNPEDVDALYVTENFAGDTDNRKWMGRFRPETVSDVVMNVMADTQTPQGVLAVVRQKRYTMDDIVKPAPDGRALAIMVLETIQDPGNLGTIIRAGEGAGITGIVMNHDTADIYNPKVVRSTMGSIFRVPFIYTAKLQETLAMLKSRGILLYAAHLQGEKWYFHENYRKPSAFLIGNEAHGLTDETAAMADTFVKIPMEGRVESLNAAIAATILMYEAKRQRMCD